MKVSIMDESKAKKVETEEDSLVIETRTALELDPSKVFPAGHVVIHHIEITCDGCECEPIIGKRYKCKVCEDIDLCEACTRSLMLARIKVAQEVGSLPESKALRNTRPHRWIARVKSENSRIKWKALQDSVPCLHPTHTFQKVINGPERAVVFSCVHGSPDANRDENKIDDCNVVLEDLNRFLDILKPSRVSCEDAAWLNCSLHETLHYTSRADEQHIQEALVEWDELIEAKTPVSDDVDFIARKYKLMGGKWMIFPSRSESDTVWKRLCHALIVEKSLGGCSEIKISTASETDDERHVLIAYTDDYSDSQGAFGVASEISRHLQSLCIKMADTRMLYKPDIYTHLGIYAKNPYNLKPTIYTKDLEYIPTDTKEC